MLRLFLTVAVGGTVLAAAYLALNPPTVERPGVRRPAQHRFEWLAPVLLVDAVFVLFLAAQAAAFFGGHDYIQRTTGLTYADYVHQGFAQLTIATALTLLVVWAAARKARLDTAADRWWLRGSLGALALLTLVVVASALHRMDLYQDAYGFTRLRLLVDLFEGWLGLVVIAVLVAGIGLRGWWLPRMALLSGAALLLGLAVVNPDAWIARHNLERYEATGKVDWSYLQGLSADADPDAGRAPARAGALRARWRRRAWRTTRWAGWNLGRARARDALERASRRAKCKVAEHRHAPNADGCGDPVHQLVDALPDGVVIADADGVVTTVNAQARRLLGESVEVGRPLSEVMALQDQESCDWYATNKPYDGLRSRVGLTEQAWFTTDGTEVLVTGRINRVGRSGPVESVALVIRSGRGRARLDRDRSDLVATVAHELRSPLTGVKGFVGTLLSKWERLNDEQKKLMLTTVHSDSERLSRLITELLDVARIDTGRLPLYPRDVDTQTLVERCVESVRAGTTRTIESSYAEPVPQVFADPDKLSPGRHQRRRQRDPARRGDRARARSRGSPSRSRAC